MLILCKADRKDIDWPEEPHSGLDPSTIIYCVMFFLFVFVFLYKHTTIRGLSAKLA